MIQKMKKSKGFTLIEMLVVIAIIAILVAIVVPVVGESTEKAKEVKDAANIRTLVTEATTEGLTGTTDVTKTYTLTQSGSFDKAFSAGDEICGVDVSTFASKTTVTITYDVDTGAVSITAA